MASEYGIEPRVAVVEQEQARQSQRVSDLERRVDALTPLLTSVVTLTVEFKNLREDLTSFMKRVDDRDDAAAQARDRQAKDRVQQRRWVVGIGVLLLTALIGAFAVIVSAHS